MSLAKHNSSGSGDPKVPIEKSKFVQTCNRLSLFMKEKGKLRDLSFEITAKNPKGVLENSPAIIPAKATTIVLLGNLDIDGVKASQADKTVKPLPEYIDLESSCELVEDPTNVAGSSKEVTKPKTGQMTIFYGGRVLVLDDVTPDRARDLMLVAQNDQNGALNNKNIEKRVELASTSKQPIHAELKAKDLDLPIARRASLHKFLAKRKDRANVRAPYQVNNPNQNLNLNGSPGGSSSGHEHSFDLNM